ncbi:MAG: galactosyldiacylglycerol synthase [Candidatus Bipolaricaulota bacterium]|nr:galactosyldiacylglycerol synthase [Candidatus Bipolaricaulota bacterium]
MIRVGFLMSDTGGGHRAAGRAIEAALGYRYPGKFTCEYFDVFRRCGLPPARWAPEIYPRWVALHQPSYDLFVSLMDRLFASRLGRRGLPAWTVRRAPCRRAMEGWDVAVVLHAAFSSYAVAVRRRVSRPIPLLGVITDMASPHSGWYHPGLDRLLVPTPSAVEKGVALGVPREKIRLVGHPAHPKFTLLAKAQAEARAELGWRPDLVTALVVSGAEGMGGIEGLARALDGLPVQLAVVAGRNEAAAARLRASPWRSPAHVYGFVTNMELLMRGADLLIGKPGPGVIAEAAILGLPMILTGGMVNEMANVGFVTEAGAGVYARTPDEVRAVLADWAARPDELRRRKENTRKIAYPQASFEIADEIARLVGVSP